MIRLRFQDMKCGLAIILLSLVSLGLTGCTTASRTVASPLPVRTGDLAALNFDFILVNATNSSPNLQAETSLLRDSILSGLRETGLFPNVEETNTNAVATGIKIVASIQDLAKVSKDSRDWFGGLAGKAQVVVQATVSDLATGKQIEGFEVMGKTDATAWAGVTDEAIRRAAAKVVAEIASLDSAAAQQQLKRF